MDLKLIYKSFVFVLLLFFQTIVFSQPFKVDIGLGTDSKNSMMIRNLDVGIGHSFTELDYIGFGVKFQSYVLVPKRNRVEDDNWTTHELLNLLVFTEARYIIGLFTSKRNSANEKKIGIFPIAKFYFDPYLPRTIKRVEGTIEQQDFVKIKSNYGNQLAYGIGFGIFVEPKHSAMYGAITFEYNTLDGLQQFRDVYISDRIYNAGTSQFVLGISIFFW